MSVIEKQLPEAICPKCSAQQSHEMKICWLCGAEIVADGSESVSVDPVWSAPERFSFSLSTLLLLMTLASVCMGLLVVAPGLGVPMCVLLVPVLVRTAMVVRRREAAGLTVSHEERVGLMLASFGVASVLAVVVSVAAFAGFCGVCLLAYEGTQIEYFAWGIGMCAISALAVWGVVGLSKWVRHRYRRDIGGPGEGFTAEDGESAEGE